jgi:hypothetical protein
LKRAHPHLDSEENDWWAMGSGEHGTLKVDLANLNLSACIAFVPYSTRRSKPTIWKTSLPISTPIDAKAWTAWGFVINASY